MQPGDFVKIVLQGPYNGPKDIIVGTVLEINPEMPHVPSDSMQLPGPIYRIKVLKTDGQVWDSWIDQRDALEIL